MRALSCAIAVASLLLTSPSHAQKPNRPRGRGVQNDRADCVERAVAVAQGPNFRHGVARCVEGQHNH